MKHKTLFRLLLKVLGVYLVVDGVGGFIEHAIWYIELPGSGAPTDFWMLLSQWAPAVLKAVIGTYLFFGGKWVVDLAIPSNRPYCHECGYDLTGAAGNIRNECGTPFRAPEEITATHE